jgi:UDP-N-acetylmuramoylalanine--D-glutamate ligase
MKHLSGINVLVLGLGESGLAMARWCARHGAAVTVWDSRERPPQFEALRANVPHAVFTHAPLSDTAIAGVQLVLKSPGLAPHDARIARVLDAARATGVPVQGELDLFAQALADLKDERGYAPDVLAVTGTNGKTTTTALTALLVERAGRRVATAGNIGPTMLDTLAAALDLEPDSADQLSLIAEDQPSPQPSPWEGEGAESPSPSSEGEGWGEGDGAIKLAPPPPTLPVFEHLPEVWVLELSSFQLDGASDFEPTAAVVLNVTQDHLDWHGSMDAYAGAKSRIYGANAVMVINHDDALVEAMVPPPVMVKGARGRPAKPVSRKVARFGLDAPRHPGDFGLVVEGGIAWLVRALESDDTVKRRKDDAEEDIHLQRLMPADALRIRGRHNAANALAALALATAIDCPLAPMLHGLREYAGEAHRVEFVGQVHDIEAFDDSKGTNVGATVAALLGLGADKEPARLAVILGGDGKGQDFSPLAAPVMRHARAVALIGRDASAVEAALANSGVAMQRHDTLEAATRWCFHQARPGDAVLLSPACASLDMFRNYEHRAEVFVAEVQAIAAEAGGALL